MPARFFTAVAVASIGFSGSTLAADMPVKAPPAPTVYSWTGFFVGVTGGYGRGKSSYQLTGENLAGVDWVRVILNDPVLQSTTFERHFSGKGGIVGAHFGYDYQFDSRWLAGIVADLNYSGIRESSFDQVARLNSAIATESKLEWFGTIRGRLGWLPTTNLLIYGTGGLAYGQVKNTARYLSLDGNFGGVGRGFFIADGSSISCDGPTCLAGSASRTSAGWAAGAGGEFRISQNVNLTVEYLHIDLDSPTVHMATVPPSIGTGAIAAAFSTHYDIIRGGLTYRFH